MSREYFELQNESAATAFLVGVVDTLSDHLMANHCPWPDTVDCDIFFIGENNELDVSDVIRQRLLMYLPFVNEEAKVRQLIERMNMPFTEISTDKGDKNAAIVEAIKQDYLGPFIGKEYADYSPEGLIEGLNEFLRTMEWHLGSPIKFFSASCNNSVLNEFYLYTISNVFAIEYNKFLILIVFGDSE